MTALAAGAKNLPQTLEDKVKYVLFGQDALKIYRAQLSAMGKAGVSREQYEQLKMEAQETAENLLRYGAEIGEEIEKLPKTSGGDRRSEVFKTALEGDFEKQKKPKQEAIKEMGFTEKQARNFQTLAKNPEAMERAIEKARRNDRIVTQQDVFDEAYYDKKTPTEKDILRQIDRDHMGYLLEKKLNPVVDIAAAQKDRENAEVIAYNNHARILKVLKEIGKMQFYMEDADIDRMAETIGADSTKRLLRSMKVEMEYLLTIYNRLVEATK